VAAKLCFKCFQPGHFASECSVSSGSVQNSGRVPVKVIDGSSGKKSDAPKIRGRAFQMTVEEAKAEPDVVTGTFPVNSLPTLVLFDTGATKSFVSLSFCKIFSLVKGRLNEPLEVEIVGKESRLVREVYRGNVLEIEGVRFPIDLIPIIMKEINVIVGVDWLSRHRAHFDCENQRIVVQTPSGGELIIRADGQKRLPKVCSLAKARRYVHRGDVNYLAYVTDSREEKKRKVVACVPVVSEFPDVFLEELPGIPPERQVEFRIDLVPGVAPVAKAPYRLAPPEMQEFSKQLRELLEKGFIRPSSSPWEPLFYLLKKGWVDADVYRL